MRRWTESAKYAHKLPVHVGRVSARALLDSGNTFESAISEQFFKRLGLTNEDLEKLDIAQVGSAKKGAGLTILGRVKKPLHLRIGGHSCTFPLRPVVLRDLAMDVNLSGPWMKSQQIDQLHSQDAIQIRGRVRVKLLAPEHQGARDRAPVRVFSIGNVTIPPGESRPVELRVPAFEAGTVEPHAGLLQGNPGLEQSYDIHTIRNVLLTPDAGRLVAGFYNSTAEPITVPANTHYGWFTPDYGNANCQVAALSAERLESEGDSAAPEWARGPTTKGNYEKRSKYLLETFQLRENPVLKKTEDLAAILAVLLRNFQVFAVNGEYGRTDLIEHHIVTPENQRPIKINRRPVNPALESELKKQVTKWLDLEVIEPCTSPWSFPLVPVRKKDHSVRWCIDYRALNAVTVQDAFQVGDVDANLARLAGSTVFTTVDASGAFHQVPVAEGSRDKTSFSTPWGQFRFVRMPFGVTGGPSTYARLVARVLEGVDPKIALAYLDDILCHTPDVASHASALDKVLQAHVKAGLKLNPKKCHFAQQKVVYLGHEVSAEGIKPVEDYVKVIKEWPVPKNRRELRAFLGKCGYYRRFLKDYAQRALPLTVKLGQDGTKDTDAFTPDPAFLKAFHDLRTALTKSPVLAHPRFDAQAEPFILDTDWSAQNEAIGGVLSQVQDGKERVIAYGGIKLTGSQTRYSSYKGELWALLAFVRKFGYYLKYKRFIVRTDHHSLKYLHSSDPPDVFAQRWLDTLSSFNFDIVYRKGEKHGNADALSRAPHIKETVPPPEDEDGRVLAAVARPAVRAPVRAERAATAPPMQTPRQARVEQEKDAALQAAARNPLGKPSPWTDGNLRVGPEGVVYCLRDGKNILAIPSHRQTEAIKAAHWLCAHRGRDATLHRLRQTAWFPHMAEKVAKVIAGCNPCATKTVPRAQKARLHVTKAAGPFEMWSMDFVGPLPTGQRGERYLLTFRCPFSKWQEAFATRDMTASTVIKHLVADIFPRYGLPLRLHSDCGPAFKSSDLKDVATALNVRTTFTPPYHPQSNPVERAHADIVKALDALSGDKPGTWPHYLPLVLYAMRCAPCRVTGVSPFQAVYGRQPEVDHELFYRLPNDSWRTEDLSTYARELRERMIKTHEEMADSLENYVLTAKRKYRATLKNYKVGDKVWLFTPKSVSGSQKFKNVFWTGPFEVCKIVNPVTFVIKGANPELPQHEQVVSIDRIRPFGPHHSFTSINWNAMPEMQVRQPEFTLLGPDDQDLDDGTGGAGGGAGGGPVAAPPTPDDDTEDEFESVLEGSEEDSPEDFATPARRILDDIPEDDAEEVDPEEEEEDPECTLKPADSDSAQVATEKGEETFKAALKRLQQRGFRTGLEGEGEPPHWPRTSTEQEKADEGVDPTLAQEVELEIPEWDQPDGDELETGAGEELPELEGAVGGQGDPKDGPRALTPTEREAQRLQELQWERARRLEEQSRARSERYHKRSAEQDRPVVGSKAEPRPEDENN